MRKFCHHEKRDIRVDISFFEMLNYELNDLSSQCTLKIYSIRSSRFAGTNILCLRSINVYERIFPADKSDLYSDGVLPVVCLKALLKADLELKPESNAIARIV